MYIICMDLEGVLVPEIWINVAETTGIEELRLTTRDIPDYDQLMRGRLDILEKKNLKLKDIQGVIQQMEPLDGAAEFLEWAREMFQLIIVSDTFVEFADPLMEKLNRPTIFCNSLSVDSAGNIFDFHLRQKDGKKHVVKALRDICYKTIAVGDSYNDVTMIKEADRGIFFRPPGKIVIEFPGFPVCRTHEELKAELIKVSES